jgi:hypothetical protein
MVNRALQGFLVATYGPEIWAEVRVQAGLGFDDFEAMLHYDDVMTLAAFEAACQVMRKPPNALLEDIGTWLVTDAQLEPLRRLLRFAGPTFLDFLNSLEELGDRGRLAMPDLDMPKIEVEQLDPSNFRLRASWVLPGIAPILLGSLRAMADDYGALAFLRLDGVEDGVECLHIQLLDAAFSEGRRFDLSGILA